MEAMASGTYEGKKGSRFVSRIFALLALAAVTVVVVAVVSNSLDSNTGATKTHAAAPPPQRPKPKNDFYVVQAGDTFSGIAAAEHVSKTRLDQLNRGRGINPDVLQPGQCLNVVKDGCPGSGG
jgi:LysM repeat protein